MNYRMVGSTSGRIIKVVALLMLLPLVVAIIYRENTYLAFLIPIVIMLIISFITDRIKIKNHTIYTRDGFVITALSWVLMSIFGAMPFILSGAIPSFVDSIFETASGFTTTGSSILTEIEHLPKSILFWRSFTHWIGGMGVLVFMLAILPQEGNSDFYLMRAEVPGPSVGGGKIVSKLRSNARILYAVYIVLTLLEVILLVAGKMPVFDSFLHAFGTAGTGGFSIKNLSIAAYNNAYFDTIITVFMIIFGVNFNIYYLIIAGSIIAALKSEELRTYLGIIIASIGLIMINTTEYFSGFWDSLRYSSFQVASIISTTGYATCDFNTWPVFSKMILAALMFIGSCAGSTGGGLKISRLIIVVKSGVKEIYKTMMPNRISMVKLDGKHIDDKAVSGVNAYFGTLMITTAVSVIIVALDNFSFETSMSAVFACINNIGPGFGEVGPLGNFSSFSVLSKLVLIFDMLAGRLELLPMLVLFTPKTYKRYG